MLLRACGRVRQPAGLLYQIDYGEADQELGTRLLVARRRPDRSPSALPLCGEVYRSARRPRMQALAIYLVVSSRTGGQRMRWSGFSKLEWQWGRWGK